MTVEGELPPPLGPGLTAGPVGRTLARLTGPMLVGHVAVVAFNLTDTYFVSRLGTTALAAMGFTFPVVMFVGSLAVGLGVGAASVISRAIGRGDPSAVRELTTHALILSLLIVAAFVAAGLLTIRPLFRLMGAEGETLALVEQYMRIWYVGMVFLVVPMVGNAAIRATGDTLSPGAIMVLANVLNLGLDPLLIFGLWGLPRMGIAGAAVATVLARASALVGALAILHFRKRMLSFERPTLRRLWDSWRALLYVGVPSAGAIVLTPISQSIFTKLASWFGPATVAAVGAAGRVETFAMMVIIPLASVLVPFIGQNWGAGRFGRARLAQKGSSLFALAWGLGMLVLLGALARPIGRLFSDDPHVVGQIALYLRLVPIGYGMMGVAILAGAAMNAINRPLHSVALSAVRVLGLCAPLAVAGAWWLGVGGLFGAIAVANLLAGCLALPWARRLLAAPVPRAGGEEV